MPEIKKKILLVDDDTFLLNMYSLKFEKSGYEVIAIPSTEEALAKLKDGMNPDVLILDVIMPGMDGIELLEAIRNQNLAPHGKVLMLSNQGEPADIERAKKIGVDGYIVKATSIPSEIVTTVNELLGKK